MQRSSSRSLFAAAAVLALLFTGVARAEIKSIVDHNDADHAKPEFKFSHVPSPSKTDAAAKAKFSIVDGERDPAGAELEVLNDGQLPTEADQPATNFFFAPNTEGGRLGIDLGAAIDVKQINTYSWHTDTRAPQVYKLYAADGKAAGFKADPKKETDPKAVGWTLLATVDTRPKEGDQAGQYGVSTADSDAKKSLGKFRYVLIDASRTEDTDPFGNTFYSEIDVVALNDAQANRELLQPPTSKPASLVVVTADGRNRITIDTSETPELTEWAAKDLAPVVKEWYPKLVEKLPSDGYEAPRQFVITFTPKYKGVAATMGTHVVGNQDFYDKHKDDVGSIVHEMVHVVQQYGLSRRNPKAGRNPGWLVEGLADYVRWYQYEPQSNGCRISKNKLPAAKYDSSYRVTANFLNYVVEKYDKDLIIKFNTAMRTGNYSDDLWKQYTGKTAPELGDEWKASLEKSLAAAG